jgi:hypothetical protein
MTETTAGAGSVTALFIGPETGEPMQAVDEVVAVVEHGLEGDRKYRREGRTEKRGS